jgi:hypothetical protein
LPLFHSPLFSLAAIFERQRQHDDAITADYFIFGDASSDTPLIIFAISFRLLLFAAFADY